MPDVFIDWREAKAANFTRTIPHVESREERAAHAIYGAVADFIIAITEARTVAEARRLYELLKPLQSVMESTKVKALNRIEELGR